MAIFSLSASTRSNWVVALEPRRYRQDSRVRRGTRSPEQHVGIGPVATQFRDIPAVRQYSNCVSSNDRAGFFKEPAPQLVLFDHPAQSWQ